MDNANSDYYKEKYLKYKNKYNELKGEMHGGKFDINEFVQKQQTNIKSLKETLMDKIESMMKKKISAKQLISYIRTFTFEEIERIKTYNLSLEEENTQIDLLINEAKRHILKIKAIAIQYAVISARKKVAALKSLLNEEISKEKKEERKTAIRIRAAAKISEIKELAIKEIFRIDNKIHLEAKQTHKVLKQEKEVAHNELKQALVVVEDATNKLVDLQDELPKKPNSEQLKELNEATTNVREATKLLKQSEKVNEVLDTKIEVSEQIVKEKTEELKQSENIKDATVGTTVDEANLTEEADHAEDLAKESKQVVSEPRPMTTEVRPMTAEVRLTARPSTRGETVSIPRPNTKGTEIVSIVSQEDINKTLALSKDERPETKTVSHPIVVKLYDEVDKLTNVEKDLKNELKIVSDIEKQTAEEEAVLQKEFEKVTNNEEKNKILEIIDEVAAKNEQAKDYKDQITQEILSVENLKEAKNDVIEKMEYADAITEKANMLEIQEATQPEFSMKTKQTKDNAMNANMEVVKSIKDAEKLEKIATEILARPPTVSLPPVEPNTSRPLTSRPMTSRPMTSTEPRPMTSVVEVIKQTTAILENVEELKDQKQILKVNVDNIEEEEKLILQKLDIANEAKDDENISKEEEIRLAKEVALVEEEARIIKNEKQEAELLVEHTEQLIKVKEETLDAVKTVVKMVNEDKSLIDKVDDNKVIDAVQNAVELIEISKQLELDRPLVENIVANPVVIPGTRPSSRTSSRLDSRTSSRSGSSLSTRIGTRHGSKSTIISRPVTQVNSEKNKIINELDQLTNQQQEIAAIINVINTEPKKSKDIKVFEDAHNKISQVIEIKEQVLENLDEVDELKENILLASKENIDTLETAVMAANIETQEVDNNISKTMEEIKNSSGITRQLLEQKLKEDMNELNETKEKSKEYNEQLKEVLEVNPTELMKEIKEVTNEAKETEKKADELLKSVNNTSLTKSINSYKTELKKDLLSGMKIPDAPVNLFMYPQPEQSGGNVKEIINNIKLYWDEARISNQRLVIGDKDKVMFDVYAENTSDPLFGSGAFTAVYKLRVKNDNTKYILRVYKRSGVEHFCDDVKIRTEYSLFNKYLIDIFYYGILDIRGNKYDYIITKEYNVFKFDNKGYPLESFVLDSDPKKDYQLKVKLLLGNIIMLNDLYKHNYIHCDYKTPNIGWDDNFNIILIDYDIQTLYLITEIKFPNVPLIGIPSTTNIIPTYLVALGYYLAEGNDIDSHIDRKTAFTDPSDNSKYFDKYSIGGLKLISTDLFMYNKEKADIENLIKEFNLDAEKHKDIQSYESMLDRITNYYKSLI